MVKFYKNGEVNRKEIEKELNEVQKGCSARIFSLEHIVENGYLLEEVASELPAWARSGLKYKAHYKVRRSYKYSARSTYITLTTTTKGTVKEVFVERKWTFSNSPSGLIEEFELPIDKVMKHFELENMKESLRRVLQDYYGVKIR